MLGGFAGCRLAHVNIGQLGAVSRRYLALQIEQYGHPEVPRLNRWHQRCAARTGVAVSPASPIVVERSVSWSATTWAPRSAADPEMPAREVGSAAAPDVSSTSSFAAESLARTYSA